MSGDARGYAWPPFDPGHTLSTRHGADSERRWRPIADRLAAEALDQAPWLGRRSFRAALAAWAKAEARVELVDAWLDEHGVLDADGVPRPAATYALRLEASAATRRAALGLDPQSFARLLVTFEQTEGAQDVLSALRAEARQMGRCEGARAAHGITGGA